MKIKSIIVVKQEEMTAIQTVIDMINRLSDGENIMISELLHDDGCCRLDTMKDCLITLREWSEVEKECPKMY